MGTRAALCIFLVVIQTCEDMVVVKRAKSSVNEMVKELKQQLMSDNDDYDYLKSTNLPLNLTNGPLFSYRTISNKNYYVESHNFKQNLKLFEDKQEIITEHISGDETTKPDLQYFEPNTEVVPCIPYNVIKPHKTRQQSTLQPCQYWPQQELNTPRTNKIQENLQQTLPKTQSPYLAQSFQPYNPINFQETYASAEENKQIIQPATNLRNVMDKNGKYNKNKHIPEKIGAISWSPSSTEVILTKVSKRLQDKFIKQQHSPTTNAQLQNTSTTTTSTLQLYTQDNIEKIEPQYQGIKINKMNRSYIWNEHPLKHIMHTKSRANWYKYRVFRFVPTTKLSTVTKQKALHTDSRGSWRLVYRESDNEKDEPPQPDSKPAETTIKMIKRLKIAQRADVVTRRPNSGEGEVGEEVDSTSALERLLHSIVQRVHIKFASPPPFSQYEKAPMANRRRFDYLRWKYTHGLI